MPLATMTNKQKIILSFYSNEEQKGWKTFGMFVQLTVDGQRSMHCILNRSIIICYYNIHCLKCKQFYWHRRIPAIIIYNDNNLMCERAHLRWRKQYQRKKNNNNYSARRSRLQFGSVFYLLLLFFSCSFDNDRHRLVA